MPTPSTPKALERKVRIRAMAPSPSAWSAVLHGRERGMAPALVRCGRTLHRRHRSCVPGGVPPRERGRGDAVREDAERNGDGYRDYERRGMRETRGLDHDDAEYD